jgi:hypothetical protein
MGAFHRSFLGCSIERDRAAGTLKIAQSGTTRNLLLRWDGRGCASALLQGSHHRALTGMSSD